MEKNRLIAAFLLFALAGCARVETDPVLGTVPGEQLLTVRIGGATTRTAFDNEAGDFTWTDGDQIALHCSASASGSVAASYKTPTLRVDANDPTVGQISVILSDGQTRNGYAVYPAASAVAAQWGSPTLQVTYPAEYQVDPAGMGNVSPTPMIAVNDPSATVPAGEPDLTFHHVGGLLRLTLNYVAGETKYITVNMGRQITGTFTVANPDTETPSVTGGDTADEVTFALTGDLTPGYDNTLVLNVPVPAGTYKSLTITALDADRQPLHSYYDEKERHFFPGRGRKQAATLSSLAMPLCLEAAEIAAVHITNPLGLTIEISYDAVNWTPITATSTEIWLGVGDKMYFRGNNNRYATSTAITSCTNIRCDGECYLYGNIMSLIQPLNFDTLTSLTSTSTFCHLFDNSNVTSHPSQRLLLPATTISTSCYAYMFSDCKSLTRAPELPALNLPYGCYQGMFQGCTSMVSAPELPSTQLNSSCYYSMFANCSSLTQAPILPATTLTTHCYNNMFSGCTSLTTAPSLPATTTEDYCYSQMFYGCKSLREAPELPALTLSNSCYSSMFYGCESLSTPPALPAKQLASQCYNQMFSHCTSLTTAPVLPATKMAYYCYGSMFYNCYSLQAAPDLPATELAENCYYQMFYGCRSLTAAPNILPATTLKTYCYYRLFSGCKQLQNAPELPALQLVSNCYSEMFLGCQLIKRIKALFLTEPVAAYTNMWVSSVSNNGTFVMNSNATWNPSLYRGIHAIPQNWTVEND